jgi:DNA polymerase-1
MIDVNKIIDEKYSDFAIMILQVHDEIIFEVNTKSVDDKRLIEFVKEVKYIMNEGVKMEVPMLVEAKAGINWAELNKLNIN